MSVTPATSTAAAANSQATAASNTTTNTTGASALASLSSNETTFLNLLMTQLKNQDPSQPLDTNQFTSELVQFSSVEQQINTNTSLSKLIQLTQAGEVMQSSAMVGKTVTVQSDHVPLQNGQGTVNFTAPGAEPVDIAIVNDNGSKVSDVQLTSVKGNNTWTWDGTDARGNTVPDGSYKISVTGTDTTGKSSALPFTVTGKATGVASDATNGVSLELGTLTVPFSSVTSVGN